MSLPFDRRPPPEAGRLSLPLDPPRIGLDLLCLGGERTGMGQVAFWLARTMPPLAPDMTFVFFLPDGVESPIAAPNVEIVRLSSGRRGPGARILAEQWDLPRIAERQRLDLLHTLAFGPPVLYDGVKVLTVHDLAFRFFPDTLPRRWRTYWNWAYGPAARSCRRLVAVSETTRSDLVRHMGCNPAMIDVVPNAAEPAYRPLRAGEDPRRDLSSLNLPRRFILHVGTLQPRKDITTLLDTFAQVRAARADIDLVVSGGRGWGYDDPVRLARERGLEGSVHFLGYVPPEAMMKLYRAAEILVLTSLYEGFGLPVLEAMCSGLPVVATSGSSIPEVTGDAALLAPPKDAAGLARHALSLLADPALRQHMRDLGLERSSLFSWEISAAKMLDVYRGLIPAGRRSHETGRPERTNGERA